MVGSSMDLEKGKTLATFRKQLSDIQYKDITQILKPSIKNICVMEKTGSGVTYTYEILYLEDGRIYEIILSVDSDKEGKYSKDVKMAAQKIAFNNATKRMQDELGMPNISIMDWDEPFSRKDWEDDNRTAAALMSNKLFIFFGYASSKYANTEYKDEASVYIMLDPLLRLRLGVKDVELYKLSKKDHTLSQANATTTAFNSPSGMAAYLNRHLYKSYLGQLNSRYNFSILGNTSFEKSSIEFVTRKNELYIKMHIPKNGECDYGIREVKAEYNTFSTLYVGAKGEKYLSLAFNHEFACNGITYKNIDVSIPYIENNNTFNEIILKLKEYSK